VTQVDDDDAPIQPKVTRGDSMISRKRTKDIKDLTTGKTITIDVDPEEQEKFEKAD